MRRDVNLGAVRQDHAFEIADGRHLERLHGSLNIGLLTPGGGRGHADRRLRGWRLGERRRRKKGEASARND